MKLTIIGASGHGKVVADIARLNGYDVIEFLDDDPNKTSCGQYPIVGKTDTDIDGDLFVAIGSSEIRKRLSNGKKLVSLIHPNSVIAEGVKIGEGTVIMAGAVVNPGTTIGNGCIVNTCSSVDHDCVLGNYVHIAVGAHLCGTVTVGDETWIGAGATINNNIAICNKCLIGSGAVVINHIDKSGTYIGIPAKRIKEDE